MEAANHRKTILGEYTPDAFCMRLTKNTPLLLRPSLELRPSKTIHFATFVHEYWHYLINISTPSRVLGIMVMNSLVALFSRTLAKYDNGMSEGHHALSESEGIHFSECLETIIETRGDYGLEYDDHAITDFEVTGVKIFQSGLKHRSLLMDWTTVILEGECLHRNNLWTPFKYRLGMQALEESLVATVEQFVYENTLPLFPYRVVEKLARYYGIRNPTKLEVAAISTLALLCKNPLYNLTVLLQEYKQNRRHDDDLEVLSMLWDNLESASSSHINRLMSGELAKFRNMYINRGMMEYASKYVADRLEQCMRMRLENPFFDLDIIKTDGVDRFLELWDLIPLPYAIQEEPNNDEDAPEIEQVIQFEMLRFERIHAGFTPSFALFVLNCQQHYVLSHVRNEGFISSSTATGKCPYYSLCTHEKRQTIPDWCKESPWKQYSNDDTETCWYGHAVAVTLGGVEIGALTDKSGSNGSIVQFPQDS
jgi:hypothetical protein